MKRYVSWGNKLLIILLLVSAVSWVNNLALSKDASVLATIASGSAHEAEAHAWEQQLAHDLWVNKVMMASLAVALVIGIYLEAKAPKQVAR